MTLEEQLMRHEGLRLRVYDDATGKPIVRGSTVQGVPTIGYGRNMVVGISAEEARHLLRNDIVRVRQELLLALPWVTLLPEIRQHVLIDMCFNLGLVGLLKFRTMLEAVHAGDYQRAAEQMRKSRWASQTKTRAVRLAWMMEYDAEPADE